MRHLAATGRVLLGLLLLIAGVLKIAFGLLFVLQGAGLVRWPASSFMIDARGWIAGGVLVMIVGVGSLLAARRQFTPPAA